MKMVEVSGGFVNPAHVVCAVREEWATKGFLSVYLTNGETLVLRDAVVYDLPLYKINDRTWVNPDHVSTVGRNVDRAQMARDNAVYTEESKYMVVEIVMDNPKYRQAFFANGGAEEHDVWSWANTLEVADYE